MAPTGWVEYAKKAVKSGPPFCLPFACRDWAPVLSSAPSFCLLVCLFACSKESLESVPTYASALATGSAESHLVWPRQVLALGKTPYLEGDLEGPPKSQVLVSEYLGRVWRLNTSEGSSEKKAELVVDATGKAGAATQIRNFLEETARDAALANDKTKVGSFLRLVA